MTNPLPAAKAVNTNPLSDEYVNAVIQQHGYQSPEAVIARLNQWIGLNGGENGVTLLMYEAHKALVKLRAPVADERVAAKCGGQLVNSRLGNPGDRVPCPVCAKHITLRRPFNGCITGWVQVPRHNRAALASAPVAGEAQPTDEQILDIADRVWREQEQDPTDKSAVLALVREVLGQAPVAGEAPSDMPTPIWWINHGLHGHITLRQDEADRARCVGAAVYQYHAAPQASEAVRKQALAALESAQRFIRNGVEFGYVRMPDADTPDPAHHTPGLIEEAIRALSSQPEQS